MRIVFVRTAAETDGEVLEYEVIGRPRGFPAQRHVHPRQSERHEVLAGALRIALGRRERVLAPGESAVIPPGTSHRHYSHGFEQGRVRVELRPALRTEQLLEQLAELSRKGRITKRGYLKPAAAARLIRDFPDEGRAAQPPARIQRGFARAVLFLSGLRERSTGEYVFVDEWDVDAPAHAIFTALADARTYPEWWIPVYKDVDSDGPPAIGRVSWQHFKGRLPYHLRTESRIVRLEPPRVVVAEVGGDLRGRGTWTLTPVGPDRTHVRFDWIVFADKPLLRTLTPLLRPLFRWNHGWAIARAMEGLEPYARGASAPASVARPGATTRSPS